MKRRQFPHDSLARAIAPKMNQWVNLLPVEAFDRVTQPPLDIDAGHWREGVVDLYRPAFLLKCCENNLLVDGLPPEPLHDTAGKRECTESIVPCWQLRRRATARGGNRYDGCRTP